MNKFQSIKKIIFLVQWPVSSYEEKSWKFDFLKSQGFEVLVFDCSTLLNNQTLVNKTISNKLDGDYIFRIDSYQAFSSLLEQEAPHAIFIDYIANHSNVTYKFEKIYRLLKKAKVQYFVISSGAMPVMTYDKNILGGFKKIISKLQKAINIFLLTDYILSKIIILLTRNNLLYPLPLKVFGGTSSEVMQLFIKNRKLAANSIIPINSFDYDSYTYSARSTISADENDKENDKDNLCVFLDEAITNHPDFDLLGIEYISGNEYFSSMNRLFDFIESKLGLRVVVAAHPRSTYELMPDVFKKRKILKGQTASLVIKSKLVVMHMSTSVSFAIIGNKPVVVVKTEGIKNNPYLDKLIDNMASNIGTESFNIDLTELSVNALNTKVNAKKYETYLYKYIKSHNSQDLPVWEIVMLEIKKICGDRYGY